MLLVGGKFRRLAIGCRSQSQRVTATPPLLLLKNSKFGKFPKKKLTVRILFFISNFNYYFYLFRFFVFFC